MSKKGKFLKTTSFNIFDARHTVLTYLLTFNLTRYVHLTCFHDHLKNSKHSFLDEEFYDLWRGISNNKINFFFNQLFEII